MSIDHIFYCDGPDCPHHMQTASATAEPFVTVSEGADHALHFCDWDCVLRYAAQKPPTETIPLAATD